MADDIKKDSGFPGSKSAGDLEAEFDAWDEQFDSMFGDLDDRAAMAKAAADAADNDSPFAESAAPFQPAPPPGPDPAEVRSPPAEPPGSYDAEVVLDVAEADVEAEIDDTQLSVPVVEGRMGLPKEPPRREPTEPTIVNDEYDDGEGVLTSALRPPEPDDDLELDATMDLFSDFDASADEVIDEVTRVIATDDKLLAATSAPPREPSRRLPLSPDALEPAGGPSKPARPVRRSPAIVRRADLDRKRKGLFEDVFRERLGQDDVDFSSETTKVADVKEIEKMVESAEADEASARSAAQAFLAKEPEAPAISFEVDDDFYDDIVIDETADESAGKKPGFEPHKTPLGGGRRVSRHVVRRASAKTGADKPTPQPVAKPAAESPKGPAGALAERSSQERFLDPESTLDLRVLADELGQPSELSVSEDGVWTMDSPFDRVKVEASPAPAPTSAPDVELEAQFDDEYELELIAPAALEPGADEPSAGADAPGSGPVGAVVPADDPADAPADAPADDDDDLQFDLIDDADQPVAASSDATTSEPEYETIVEVDLGVELGDGHSDGHSDSGAGAIEPASRAEDALAAVGAIAAGEIPARPASALERGAKSGDDSAIDSEQATARVDPSVVARVLAQERAALSEVDVAPDLPAAVLPSVEPTIDFGLIALPEQAEPSSSELRRQEIAAEMALLERERELLEEPAALSRLWLEAGRLAEQLGDIENARACYEDALAADPRQPSATRALRRLERQSSSWAEAVRFLEAELAESGPVEERALRAHGADLLMACGEQDLARVAVGDLLDRDRRNVRALLANLELAFIDNREDELVETLEQLAEAVAEPGLSASLGGARGTAVEHRARGDGPAAAAHREQARKALAAYRASAEAGSRWGRTSLARSARQAGDVGMALAAIEGLAASDLATRDPAAMAALCWRQSSWAARDGRPSEAVDALEQACEHAPAETFLLSELAAARLAAGPSEEAAEVLLQLASSAASPVEQALAYVRAAACLGALGRHDEAIDGLRRARALDPSNPRAVVALEEALAASGDVDGLIELDRQSAQGNPAAAVFERVRASRRLVEALRPDEAIATLTRGRAEIADSRPLCRELLRLLEQTERYDERVDLFFELVEGSGASADGASDPERMLYRAASAATQRAFWLDSMLTRAETSPIGSGPESDGAGAGEGAGQGRSASEEDAAARQNELRNRTITRAIDSWHQVLEAEPELTYAHQAIIALGEMLGDAAVLDDALERAQLAASNPARAITLALRRVSALEADEVARAEDICREAIGLAPADPRASLALTQVLVGDRRYADAAAVLEERASILDGGEEASALRFRAAAQLLEHADEPAPAAQTARALLDSRPDFWAAADMLEEAERRMGDVVAAYATLEGDKTGRQAGFAQLIHAAEAYCDIAGEPARALALYKKALALRPGDTLARAGLIRAAEAAGETSMLAELASRQLLEAEDFGDSLAKADAFEEMARIDGELRGDPEAALVSYESAAAADPGRPWVWRIIERAYITAERWGDLAALYDREVSALPAGRDRLALALERARMARELGEAEDKILACYQAAHQLDRSCRTALFHLEIDARKRGPSLTLAALQSDIADYFAGDIRARAAFLTRSAETLSDVGEIDPGIERCKEASGIYNEARGAGYPPALFAWRHIALQGKLWLDVAEAALAEADVARSSAERASLSHLAGVALMDRALTGERAVPALRQVLAADPMHVDAFVRLRILFDEQGEHDDLVELMSARLEVEEAPLGKARLHRALADLYRNFRDDRDSAQRHLQAVLELAPSDLGAVAALSDIAWEQGSWAEAAEALMARARLEPSQQILKGIFYRLGIIYAEHIPDAKRAVGAFKRVLTYAPQDEGALDHLARLGMETGDWKLALGACERLLKLDHEPETRVEYLHRVGQIYNTGLGDRSRAERAFLLALDELPTSDRALSAAVSFFQSTGDTRSLRVHLDRVIGAMRARLGEDMSDGIAYRVIARALEARETAGVAGSRASARIVAELALLFGFIEEAEDSIAALAKEASSIELGIAGLETVNVDDRLFPAAVPTSARQLFGLLGDRVAKHVGIDLRRYGVGRSERLRKRDHPVLAIAHEIANRMGVEQLALYVSEKEPMIVACEPTNPISLIVGSHLATPERATELRFCVGRAIKLVSSSLAVPARMSSEELGVFITALLRQFDPEYVVAGVDAAAVAQQQQRLKRLIPSGMMQELKLLAFDMAGTRLDYQGLHAGIQAAGDRAGLLACGSIRAALSVLCGMRGHSDLARAAAEDKRVAGLIEFAIGEDHVALRGRLDRQAT